MEAIKYETNRQIVGLVETAKSHLAAFRYSLFNHYESTQGWFCKRGERCLHIAAFLGLTLRFQIGFSLIDDAANAAAPEFVRFLQRHEQIEELGDILYVLMIIFSYLGGRRRLRELEATGVIEDTDYAYYLERYAVALGRVARDMLLRMRDCVDGFMALNVLRLT